MKYNFLRKLILNEKDTKLCYEIIKNNMIEIGVKVIPQDYIIWQSALNRNITNFKNFYFFLIKQGEEIVGFVEIKKCQDYLYLSEIQLAPKVKQTKVILYTLKFLFENQSFNNFDTIYFHINKSNKMSHKTFTHLGGEIVEELKINNKYKITREKVENYLNKFNKD